MTQVETRDNTAVLAELLRGDLSFRDNGAASLLHTLHAYAARFPAQLPKHFIERLSNPGDIVLDPMSGSGATGIEAWLAGRNSINVDLDPLAVRISRAKTTWIAPQDLSEAGGRVLEAATALLRDADLLSSYRASVDEATRDFFDYWFLEETQAELAALAQAIGETPSSAVRNVLEVIFSSVIVTKSGGVSLARDLAHTRPHKVKDKTPGSPIKRFVAQLARAIKAYAEVSGFRLGESLSLLADCRSLPMPDESVDLVVTSPPYANALDYMRAHKFALTWLGQGVGGLGLLRGQYIGAERWSSVEGILLPANVELCVEQLAQKDVQKARVLDKYFRDMTLAIREMYRVLRPGCAAVVVVGPSTMRGMTIRTHEHLASISEQVGFDVVGVARRSLDRDRRMMPAGLRPNGDSQIEKRMHEEFIVGLVKPVSA